MRKVITIIVLVLCCQVISAQEFRTENEVDSWEEQEIRFAQEEFMKDSVAFMADRRDILKKKVENIRNEALKKKKKLARPIKRTMPANPLSGSNMEQWTNECKNYLKDLSGEDDLANTRKFLHAFFSKNDDVRQYISIMNDMVSMNNLLKQRGIRIEELDLFVNDLYSVMFADSVLCSPYNKQNRFNAQNKLKGLKALTNRQKGCAYVDSLRHGLDIYYLSTSNMVDFIQEVEDCYNNYMAAKTDEEKDNVSKELTSSIDFDARVENFRSVKYMSDMFDKIVMEILCYDDNNHYVFEEFDMEGLKRIKENLEKMRHPQK